MFIKLLKKIMSSFTFCGPCIAISLRNEDQQVSISFLNSFQ